MKQDKNELIVWSSKLSCGIKLIDEQHKGLVDLVNDMFSHVTGNYAYEKDYFKSVIQETVKYVKTHFATEEKIMLAANFSGYTEHRQKHEDFILAVIESIRDYEAGKRFTLLTFTRFLRDWILSHIALMDKQYFEYFRKIATRNADGKIVLNLKKIGNGM